MCEGKAGRGRESETSPFCPPSTGARIVHFCGHDCVPWDLLALGLCDEVKKAGGGTKELRFFDEIRGEASGGACIPVLPILYPVGLPVVWWCVASVQAGSAVLASEPRPVCCVDCAAHFSRPPNRNDGDHPHLSRPTRQVQSFGEV